MRISPACLRRLELETATEEPVLSSKAIGEHLFIDDIDCLCYDSKGRLYLAETAH